MVAGRAVIRALSHSINFSRYPLHAKVFSFNRLITAMTVSLLGQVDTTYEPLVRQ
jgi:hypothetical protein